MDLPFNKIGIAHFTCGLIFSQSRDLYLKTISLLPTEKLTCLFTKAANLGVGIELNSEDMNFTDEEAEIVLRPYLIAKECGCKFYFGCDAHHPKDFESAPARYERAINLLNLTENDKFKL